MELVQATGILTIKGPNNSLKLQQFVEGEQEIPWKYVTDWKWSKGIWTVTIERMLDETN